ncbi:MAG: hypothetical protein JRC99_11495, partial [Deltaproteobacteria bacterium]|nr:hypothetical protein [Deltaproteobacteria bacterium]
MADAGRMMLTDKLAAERQEARDLREAGLRKSMAKTDREFRTGEREAKTASDLSREGLRIAADAQKQESADAAALERTKYKVDNKTTTPKNPQLLDYTDNKGNPQQAVLEVKKDGSLVGRRINIEGDGGAEDIVASTANTEQAVKEYKSKASVTESDQSQFGMT